MPNVKGEYYTLRGNRILHVAGMNHNHDGHRTTRYFTGAFLRLDEMTVGYDRDGHPSYDVGCVPVTKEEKLNIRAKFAKARKLKVFREFFHMR